MKSHYRAVVIGGGVVGASVLYHLAKMGWKDVCLIERNILTAGSSWHAAGGFHALNADPNIASLQAYTIDLLSEIEKESGQSVGMHMTGGMTLAGTPDRWEWLQSAYRTFQSIGIEDVHLITPKEAQEKCPIMSTHGILGGMWADREGYVDTTGTVHAYAGAAKKHGAEIVEHNRVLELNQTATGWEVVTEKGTIQTEHVVNAAGLWAKQVGRMAGIELPVSPLNHHYLISDTIPELEQLDFEIPLTVDLEGFTYIRQDQKGMLMGIYEVDHQHWMMDGAPWEYGFELQQEDTDRIERELTLGFERYPALQNVGVKTWVNGAFTFSPDGNPLVGPVQRQERLLVRLCRDGGLPAGRRRRQVAGGMDDPRGARGRCLRHGCGALRRLRPEQALHQGDHGAVLHPPFRDDLSQRTAARRAPAENGTGLFGHECRGLPLGCELGTGSAALLRAGRRVH